MTPQTVTPPSTFGTALIDHMAIVRWKGGAWGKHQLVPLEPFPLHPAAHVLHYGSSCFEGLKAHRGVDGIVRIFRLDRHVARLRQSAQALVLPIPPTDILVEAIVDVVRAGIEAVPDAPGSLYVRPTLIGTESNIGAATRPSAEATLFVLAGPVGDYFADGAHPLTVAIEDESPRTTPRFGMVKAGANYAMALGPTVRAAGQLGADQVLFAPNGQIEETGASNFLLLDAERIITPELTDSFLHGITRDSVLRIAGDLGYLVEERPVAVEEVLAWAARPDAEAALSGTAALLAGVGRIVHKGRSITVGSGELGPTTTAIRKALTDTHAAKRPDPQGWLTAVTGSNEQSRRLGRRSISGR